ncbi:biopolymer transporter ExbD [Leptolyngbya sp. FACHB-321]|uniref:ExbD/TolR family protein n=1 Tax=Leptolyngbya sp. FACHB-321 TaxID=2692807 RepID=UPI0016882673|nr:biopolymer transporter ExbD [Leptolyngbya sp. FACHB-321]MBD2035203.1 biopolymer transporter ExbD [Leptolyngbya sp. FACHB-321]
MRFKSKQKGSELLDVNLIPMMDVLMTVLTFFILISMTLTTQQSVDVTLPTASEGTKEQKLPDPLIVGLTRQGQMTVSNTPVTQDQLATQMVEYLNKNPQGAIVLKADNQLAYQKVVQVLGTMQAIGGERVSLAIDPPRS